MQSRPVSTPEFSLKSCAENHCQFSNVLNGNNNDSSDEVLDIFGDLISSSSSSDTLKNLILFTSEAETKLAQLQREHAEQVKGFRKEYIREMEVVKIEKECKAKNRREVLRVANEEHKKLEAQASQLRAQEHDLE
ncbi:hypothetical protein JHK85_022771 [Glycine max]|nr:hypothetical protein JHK85_022771 [Glycine max]KAG5026392.1 hypothetical protein JHK86_022306 [Glycine max]